MLETEIHLFRYSAILLFRIPCFTTSHSLLCKHLYYLCICYMYERLHRKKFLDFHVCISVKFHCNIIPTVGKFHSSHSVFVIVNGKCLLSILGNTICLFPLWVTNISILGNKFYVMGNTICLFPSWVFRGYINGLKIYKYFHSGK